MKRLKIFIITLFILITCSIGSNVFAASTDKLISLGRNGYNITVTKGTTVNDIIGVLGQPKIQTVSVFGGQAYTFYTDDNYTNYLYIETAKNGKIASFGSVDPSYKIYDVNTQGYGDEYEYYNNGILHGYLFSNSGTVAGGVYYNPEALYGANNSNAKILMINSFQDTYMSNPTKYLRGISEHAVTMYNALSTILGNKTNLEFNEDFFYINEQFKKFGTTTREYIRDMGKVTLCMKTIPLVENVEISTYGYYLLSPMYWADLVKKSKNIQFGEKNQAVFYYNENTKELFACGLRADTYDKTDSVELTTDEQSKLSAGRYEYNQSKINFRKDSAIYDVVPVATSPSKLVAGKLKPSKEQGILDYVNAIRAGAGLNKLTLDRDAYKTAQYLATLMSYRWNVLKLDIQHYPPKPDGVTNEYYKIAVEDGASYSENIGRIANETTVENMKMHINQFIDDGAEDPQLFGHRKALLNNNITKFGYGVSPNIGVNEFVTGSRNSDNFVEAWPSKGITFMESYTQRTKWTIQFIDKYTITNKTTVTVKCLNTNKTYEFNEETNTNSKVFLRHMNSVATLNNKVVLYDSGIVPQAGYVYEITVKNLQDNATKANTSYQYRSVFEYADIDNYPSKLSSIKINPPNLKKVTDMDVYYVPLNNEVNLDVTIDSNVVDKKITWISSNSDAVEVKQNGTIIAKKLTDEDVTITVGYDGSNITDQIVVRPYRKIDEVKLDKTNLTMLASSSKVTSSSLPKTSPLTITYIPTDNTEITDITWKVISYTNPNVEYDIDDPQITKYIKVTKTNNSKVVNIEAVNVEDSNNKYIVMAIVTGISGTYTGACDVTIHLPLTGVQIETITTGVDIIGKVTNLNYNTFNNKYFKLNAKVLPTNTTDSTDVTWSTGDANIVSNYDNNGQFKIEKEGSTTITAKSTANNSISDTITFNVNATLTKLSLSGTSNIYIKSGETKTDQLRLSRVPDIDNDPIEYSSNKEEIATVGTNNGLVEFKKPGDVTITARSKTVPSVSAIFTYKVYLYVDDFRFSGLGQIQELQVGDKCTHTPTFKPSDASFKDKVTYSSNNPSVASVNSKTGEVTAISPGQAVIKATIAGNYVSSNGQIVREYTVKVVAPLTGVNLPATKKMVINSSYTFSPELLPKNTTDTCSYKYESDRTDIVEINQTTGVAKAKQLGKANIKVTVTTNRGTQFTASTEVEVINYLPGDVDLSGKVDAVDAALVLTLFKNHNATELNIAIGDVDSSGVLDAVDAMQILTMYKNNVYGQ